jgi:hypothetical protein
MKSLSCQDGTKSFRRNVSALHPFLPQFPLNLMLLCQGYSGYVNISKAMGMDMMSHYVFVESEGDPTSDPVILWSNGGPGASSLFGLMAELGPLLLNDQSLLGEVNFSHTHFILSMILTGFFFSTAVRNDWSADFVLQSLRMDAGKTSFKGV